MVWGLFVFVFFCSFGQSYWDRKFLPRSENTVRQTTVEVQQLKIPDKVSPDASKNVYVLGEQILLNWIGAILASGI